MRPAPQAVPATPPAGGTRLQAEPASLPGRWAAAGEQRGRSEVRAPAWPSSLHTPRASSGGGTGEWGLVVGRGGTRASPGAGGGRTPAHSLPRQPFAWARLVLARGDVHHPHPPADGGTNGSHTCPPQQGEAPLPCAMPPPGRRCFLASPHQTCVPWGTRACPAMVHGQHSVPHRVPVSFTTQDIVVLTLPWKAGVYFSGEQAVRALL